MNSDLIFYILPRLGKAPIVHHSDTVQKVHNQQSKQHLSDEEKELNTQEREAREKHEGKSAKEEEPGNDAGSDEHGAQEMKQDKHDSASQDHNYTDAEGRRHIDDYA